MNEVLNMDLNDISRQSKESTFICTWEAEEVARFKDLVGKGES